MLEYILDDDTDVFCGYWYVVNGEPKRSPIQGTIADLKKLWGVTEIYNCDAVERKLPLMGFEIC